MRECNSTEPDTVGICPACDGTRVSLVPAYDGDRMEKEPCMYCHGAGEAEGGYGHEPGH